MKTIALINIKQVNDGSAIDRIVGMKSNHIASIEKELKTFFDSATTQIIKRGPKTSKQRQIEKSFESYYLCDMYQLARAIDVFAHELELLERYELHIVGVNTSKSNRMVCHKDKVAETRECWCNLVDIILPDETLESIKRDILNDD